MDSMTGIPVVQYTFKRSDQVTTIQSKSRTLMDSRYTSTQSSCSKASLPLTTERRYSVSSCVATHRLSLTRHSCREHHRKPFWRTLSARLPPDIVGLTGEVQHVLDGEALLHLHILLVRHQFITRLSIYLFFVKNKVQ